MYVYMHVYMYMKCMLIYVYKNNPMKTSKNNYNNEFRTNENFPNNNNNNNFLLFKKLNQISSVEILDQFFQTVSICK